MTGIILFSSFKIKRFRKGFPFLYNKWSGIVGVILSGVLICALVLINQVRPSHEMGIWILSGVAVCIIAIIFWCKHAIFKLYKQRINEREKQERERIIAEKDARIKAIQADNKIMAERIHKDSNWIRTIQETLEPFVENDAKARLIYERIEFLLRERESLDGIHAHYKNEAMAKIIHRDAKLLPALQESFLSFVGSISDTHDNSDGNKFLMWELESIIDFPTTNSLLHRNSILLPVMKELLEPFVETDTDARFIYNRVMFLLGEQGSLIKDEIEDDDEVMATIIHRDAKLMQAMDEKITAVREDNFIDARMRIHDRIGFLMFGRENIVDFPTTNNPLMDGILKHMMLKAAEKGIRMSVEIEYDLSELDKIAISYFDFETIIVDLLENAIIATTKCEHKQIRISFGKDDGFFAITVQDSGIPFEQETLENLGKKPASTYLNEGGSGIGYMSIFNIMGIYNASLIIRKFSPKPDGFTKSVTFRLDGNNSYSINTDCQGTV